MGTTIQGHQQEGISYDEMEYDTLYYRYEKETLYMKTHDNRLISFNEDQHCPEVLNHARAMEDFRKAPDSVVITITNKE